MKKKSCTAAKTRYQRALSRARKLDSVAKKHILAAYTAEFELRQAKRDLCRKS